MIPIPAPLVPLLVGRAVAWLERQRARHRPRAGPIPPAIAAAVAPFFLPETLAAARFRVVPALVPAPLAKLLARTGWKLPFPLERVWGIAFIDVVVLLERVPDAHRPALVFHELVHVAQYRLLGARGFVERYVRGWLAGGRRYREIPLEKDAYDLAKRFAAEPGKPFSVEAEVARRLGPGRGAAG